ncbi:sensor histidine kinase [Undibacterium fentianense]|uniref:Histidine kinase n=1 Tax=Undibacterium fentianense TaxID=2828728 RepID=A0A941IBP8_9BURK|nr:histidine kinase [Undibacterium fentianense]MBR7799309.1 histidine kinase [Undibacterium fentianense]
MRQHLKTLTWLIIFNTAIALFITVVLRTGQSLLVNWVFSMLIGFSINIVISAMRWVIWRQQKPHRIAFLIVCIAAAPIGYFIGGSIGMLYYGYKAPSFMSVMRSGEGILVIMSAFISLFGGVFFWNQSKVAELETEQEKEKARSAAIERQAMQAQLQLLQAQIEPHMLFNTLANLQGLIAIDPERAQHMLGQLIRYLRATLNSSRTEQTNLKHEFELLESYLELLAIRMGKRLSYQIELPSELEQCAIAPMLLQPLVENAIKHGVEPKLEGGNIFVKAEMRQDALQLSVIDTGLGLPPDYDEHYRSPDNQSHVGNANVRERLLALYGPGAHLHLKNNAPQGVIATLTIPQSHPNHV